jgi:hypothetical protein
MFKTFKPFNRYAEPVLSKVEGFKPFKTESVSVVSMIPNVNRSRRQLEREAYPEQDQRLQIVETQR